MSNRGTVYVVPEYQMSSGDVGGCLLRDNGEVPWSHMSSSVSWLQRDLTNGFADRREQLNAWYPNGYDVVVVTEGVEIPADVLERNRLVSLPGERSRQLSHYCIRTR